MIFQKYPHILFSYSKAKDGDMLKEQHRQRLLKHLNIDPQDLITVHQVHGTNIIKVSKREETNPNTEADGLIVNQPGIYLGILTADCLPIAFYDPTRGAIGLIHAGWKGLDQDIIYSLIQAMQHHFGSDPQDLLVEIGPSIGPCCYTHPSDLKQKDDPKWQPYILEGADDSYGLDLWSFAENQLLESGVLKGNIDNPKICTYHTNQYFSHRKVMDKKLSQDPRFITILGIRGATSNQEDAY